MKRIRVLLAMLFIATQLFGCASQGSETAVGDSAALTKEDFIGKRVAVQTGTVYEDVFRENVGEATFLQFNNSLECVEAVKSGRADVTLEDEPILRKYAAKNPGLIIIEPPISDEEYGIMVSKDKPELREKLNEFYKIIKEDGTYDDMLKRWVDSAEYSSMPEIGKGTGELLKAGVVCIVEPFGYYGANGEMLGFDVEYILRFAEFANMRVEFSDYDFASRISAISSGKADICAGLATITEERKKAIDFTVPYYIGGISLVALGNHQVLQKSFFEGLKDSFYNNLIFEGRYKTVLSGLWTTIIISVFSLILGTLLGFLICFLSMSRKKLLNIIAKIYIYLLRGTPIVVLLMITFYIVFAKVDINPILVAIIAFSLNSGAFIGEIIRSAILTVDKGQVEAARSMGFSAISAFFTVTLPQAVRVALPVYKSEFISLVKSTAIVGYISIVDLTKAGDIIRSRTFDAFFPLIAVAVVYLITIGVFIWFFDLLNKMTDKRLRRAK